MATKTTKKTQTIKKANLSLPMHDLMGKASGNTELPKELFSAKVNDTLMSQAVYVYLNNQRRGTVAQKTRGDVKASTRKIYRQKGTGRARHGALSAPIFVGGGVTFAAKPREFKKKLSKKMKFLALASALTSRLQSENITLLDTTKATGKTKEIAQAVRNLKLDGKKRSILLLTDGKNSILKQAARNLDGVTILPADSANTYEVLKNKNILLTKDGLETMKTHFLKVEKKEKETAKKN